MTTVNSGTGTVNYYSTGVVTGTGTTFGASGAGHTEAQVGDIIRFGIRDADTSNGFTTYFGDAVIVKLLHSHTVIDDWFYCWSAVGPIAVHHSPFLSVLRALLLIPNYSRT